jgi:predicted TPR repeat methyltransferase
MKRVPTSLLVRIGTQLDAEDRDEMAIPSYLHRNPALRWIAFRRLEVVAQRLARLLRDRARPRTVLDFGCGSGVLLPEICSLAESVYGVDRVLSAARTLVAELALDHVVLLSPEELAARSDVSADVIVAAEVLEHVENLDETMQMFRRALKPGGRILVSVPTENTLYRIGRRIAGFSGHYHHANAASIDRDIRRMGFRCVWRSTIPAPGPLCIYWVLEYTDAAGAA